MKRDERSFILNRSVKFVFPVSCFFNYTKWWMYVCIHNQISSRALIGQNLQLKFLIRYVFSVISMVEFNIIILPKVMLSYMMFVCNIILSLICWRTWSCDPQLLFNWEKTNSSAHKPIILNCCPNGKNSAWLTMYTQIGQQIS